MHAHGQGRGGGAERAKRPVARPAAGLLACVVVVLYHKAHALYPLYPRRACRWARAARRVPLRRVLEWPAAGPDGRV
jgi:hypothetical protein